MGEFKTFGTVQSHHRDLAAGMFLIRPIGGQCRVIEEVARRMEAAGELDQFLDILQSAFGALRAASPQHGPIAGPIQQHGKLIGDGCGDVGADRLDLISELQPLCAGAWGKSGGFDGAQQRDAAPLGFRLQDFDRLRPKAARGTLMTRRTASSDWGSSGA